MKKAILAIAVVSLFLIPGLAVASSTPDPEEEGIFNKRWPTVGQVILKEAYINLPDGRESPMPGSFTVTGNGVQVFNVGDRAFVIMEPGMKSATVTATYTPGGWSFLGWLFGGIGLLRGLAQYRHYAAKSTSVTVEDTLGIFRGSTEYVSFSWQYQEP
jgi:hypothetical protein